MRVVRLTVRLVSVCQKDVVVGCLVWEASMRAWVRGARRREAELHGGWRADSGTPAHNAELQLCGDCALAEDVERHAWREQKLIDRGP